jgi:uncharacterized protein YndB with AHSA1/START domain
MRCRFGARRIVASAGNVPAHGVRIMPSTIRLHRVFAAPPDRVYRAFTDPAALCKWLPPDGFTCTVHAFEAAVGGRYRMSFTNFATGGSHSFGGEFLELVPGERIRHTDAFEDANLPGEIVVTIALSAVSCGTEVHIDQAGVPDAIAPEGCYLGWQQSLTLLARLVEPDIPDGV